MKKKRKRQAEKKKWDKLIDKYGDLYLADTEAEEIDRDDFENWYYTYGHELK